MANLITGYAVDTNTQNGYLAPEQQFVCLMGGEVETRGRLVQTGWIVRMDGSDADGWTVQTLSGSLYTLGEPVDGEANEAAAAIREALSRLQSGPVDGYHPATLRWILTSLRD
jgi:hypothetical protein